MTSNQCLLTLSERKLKTLFYHKFLPRESEHFKLLPNFLLGDKTEKFQSWIFRHHQFLIKFIQEGLWNDESFRKELGCTSSDKWAELTVFIEIVKSSITSIQREISLIGTETSFFLSAGCLPKRGGGDDKFFSAFSLHQTLPIPTVRQLFDNQPNYYFKNCLIWEGA